MWPNLFWGFDAYDGSNFNAFPIYFPTEFMQTEPRDQSSCQQLPMEQATEPSMNPDQEDIVEGERTTANFPTSKKLYHLLRMQIRICPG